MGFRVEGLGSGVEGLGLRGKCLRAWCLIRLRDPWAVKLTYPMNRMKDSMRSALHPGAASEHSPARARPAVASETARSQLLSSSAARMQTSLEARGPLRIRVQG